MTDLHRWHLEQVDPALDAAGDRLCEATKSMALGHFHPSGTGHLAIGDALVAIAKAQAEIAECRRLTAEALEQIAAAEPMLEAAE